MTTTTLAFVAILTGGAIGVLLQKSRLCHASMLSDLFLFRTLSRNGAGLLLATGLTMFGWSVIYFVRGTTGFWLPAWGWYGIIGGGIFGVGMIVASGCMMSALYRAASGSIRYLVVLLSTGVGYLAYGMLYPYFLLHYFTPLWVGPGKTIFAIPPFPAPLLVALVLLGCLGIYVVFVGRITVLLERGKDRGLGSYLAAGKDDLSEGIQEYAREVTTDKPVRTRFQDRWDPRTCGIGLAVVTTGWLWIHNVWTVSGPEAGWVAFIVDSLGLTTSATRRWIGAKYPGSGAAITPGMLVIASAFVGAFISAMYSGDFEIRWPEYGVLPYATGGGLLMGIGASLAPGCNIGNLYTGIAQLSVHGLIASIGIVLGAYVATRILY